MQSRGLQTTAKVALPLTPTRPRNFDLPIAISRLEDHEVTAYAKTLHALITRETAAGGAEREPGEPGGEPGSQQQKRSQA